MVKRLIMMALLIAIASVLCACGTTERWPRICIEPTDYRFDCINIPLRDGYKFAEDVYDIAETEVGYDIIIHVEVSRETTNKGGVTE